MRQLGFDTTLVAKRQEVERSAPEGKEKVRRTSVRAQRAAFAEVTFGS